METQARASSLMRRFFRIIILKAIAKEKDMAGVETSGYGRPYP